MRISRPSGRRGGPCVRPARQQLGAVGAGDQVPAVGVGQEVLAGRDTQSSFAELFGEPLRPPLLVGAADVVLDHRVDPLERVAIAGPAPFEAREIAQ